MSAKTTTRRDQPAGSAHDLNESAAEFETFAEKAADKFRDVADEAEQFAGRAAEQGRDAAEKVQEVAGTNDDTRDGSRPRVLPRCALEKVAEIASR
jgi:hypothetical protein